MSQIVWIESSVKREASKRGRVYWTSFTLPYLLFIFEFHIPSNPSTLLGCVVVVRKYVRTGSSQT